MNEGIWKYIGMKGIRKKGNIYCNDRKSFLMSICNEKGRSTRTKKEGLKRKEIVILLVAEFKNLSNMC